MALTPDELILIAPDAAKLVSLLTKALKKDEDGKVRITHEEGKEIKSLLVRLALSVTKDALD